VVGLVLEVRARVVDARVLYLVAIFCSCWVVVDFFLAVCSVHYACRFHCVEAVDLVRYASCCVSLLGSLTLP